MPFVFEDQQPQEPPRFVFEEAEAGPEQPRFVMEDASSPLVSQPQPPAPKGILSKAVDTFTGAAARVAQGVNTGMGGMLQSFGLDQGAEAYKEGADYWGKVAAENGSSGLPAKVYEGVGAAPIGVAEFVAGPVYAGAKGAVEGYREGGIPGALEKAVLEATKRIGIGKVFHGIENTGLTGVTKAAALGTVMGGQTAAEQAMTPGGMQAEDIAASAITGTMLSVNGRSGKTEAVRQNLLREGVQPEIAADLAGRVPETFTPETARSPEASRFVFEDQVEAPRQPIVFTDPQGRPLDVPTDTRPPESIGPLVSEIDGGSIRFESEPRPVELVEVKNSPVEASKDFTPLTTPSPVAETGLEAAEFSQEPILREARQQPEAGRFVFEDSMTDMQPAEAARQAAAGTLNQVYPEGSPDIGLSVKPAVVRDDTVAGIPITHADEKGRFKSADDQVETRWKAANGLDSGPGLVDRSKAFIHRMLSETQHFPELDTTSYGGKRTADILRRFESSAVAAKAKTAEHLHGLTATFGPKKMDVFTRKVILDDLMNESAKERQLPFGYTPETLQKDHAAVSAIAEAHPDIKAAIERRAEVSKALVTELVDNNLLPVESVLKPEALEHYQKTGEYTPEDINTGYFRHQVLEHANARKWAGLSTAGDVRNKTRGWQKGRQGSELDINTNFLEAEFEVFSQSMKELATKKTLDEVLTLNDLTPELKAQAKKEGVEDWKTLIPEGHTAWQPEKGSVFYRGQTMPEQIVTKFIEENPAFADVAEKFREATILGGRKAEVIIPEGLAKTLDGLRGGREEATLDTINKKLIGGWKVWTLLSPRRALKYNINNMSGDMDVALAADPAIILKHLPTAWRNAWNLRAGQAMTKDQVDMLYRGVIDAGISINEIPDINKLPGFQRLTETERKQTLRQALQSGDLTKLAPPNLLAKYFDTVSGLTQLREGLIREAAYLRAKELLERGQKVYWASKPAEIDALPNIKDKAAKLSRELIGDYGNLSAHGEKIRTRFIPFWSWMEINSPRYYRLFKNAATKGEAGSTAARMAGVGTRKAAGAALGVAEKIFLTQVLFASVSAFNHLVHPQEEEQLGDADRKQLHVILGKSSSGKILTARFQGAFSDALSWFGLENYTETWRQLQNDKMDAGDLAKKMLMATPNKLVNATSPFFKLAAEVISSKSFYPEITKPMPIRDKKEHIARFFSLDEEYKAMTGKPSRGYLDGLKKTILYESDPGEQAYNTIRQQAFKFMQKNGKEIPSGEPTARSNALYYYKQALRYGDTESAAKYKQEYFNAGGKAEGMDNSIKKSHPLAAIPENMRTKFRMTLSASEREALRRSVTWYRNVYYGKP